jgi:hypothetical protein
MEGDGCRIRERCGAPCPAPAAAQAVLIPVPRNATTRVWSPACIRAMVLSAGSRRLPRGYCCVPGREVWRQRSAQRLARFGHCGHHCLGALLACLSRLQARVRGKRHTSILSLFFLVKKKNSVVYSIS